MRILLAQNSPYYPAHGGGDKSNRLLMEALAARGHACRAVARISHFGEAGHVRYLEDLARRGVAPLHVREGVVAFHRLGVEVRVVTNANLRHTFAAEASRFRPDIILASTDDPAQLLLEAALRVPGARVVYLVRATLAVPFGPDSAFPSEAKTEAIRRADAVVGVSQYVADYIRRSAGIDAVHVPISLLEPGEWPDLGRFDNEFVTLTNPCAVKGISILLALADAMPHTAFAAVPTWGTNLQDRAALAARPNIRLLDPVDDINQLLKRTRVLLAPSLWAEARSRIVLEAMLRGVPVVASDVGGLPEAKMGVPYLLPVSPITSYQPRLDEQMVPVADVPAQDIGPWRAALERLLTSPDHYREIAGASRAAALRYAARLTVEPLEALLVAAMNRPGRAMEAAPRPAGDLSPDKRRLLAVLLRKKAAPAAWFPGAAVAETVAVAETSESAGGRGADEVTSLHGRLGVGGAESATSVAGRGADSASDRGTAGEIRNPQSSLGVGTVESASRVAGPGADSASDRGTAGEIRNPQSSLGVGGGESASPVAGPGADSASDRGTAGEIRNPQSSLGVGGAESASPVVGRGADSASDRGTAGGIRNPQSNLRVGGAESASPAAGSDTLEAPGAGRRHTPGAAADPSPAGGRGAHTAEGSSAGAIADRRDGEVRGERPLCRLFCFPHAGGGAATFAAWGGALPVEVCPVRLPGRESRHAEAAFERMGPLIDALGDAIQPYLGSCFAFFGHSMGAAVAFELARWLRGRGLHTPRALFAAGARAPQFRRGHVAAPDPSDEQFAAELRSLEGVPPAVLDDPDVLRVFLPVLRADAALYRRYSYRENTPLTVPIRAYGGERDPNVGREHLEAWAEQTTASFALRWFPDGHFFLQSNQAEFLAALSRDLEELC